MPPVSKSKLAANALTALRNKGRLKVFPSQEGGMAEVVLLAIVARGTSLPAARKALDTVKRSVVNWNELRVTQVSEVAGFMSGVRDAQNKATAVHEVLSNIFEGTHDLQLSFLEGASAEEARDFLRGLGALSDDIVTEVILSGKGHFNMIADSDVLRVVRRLGLAQKAGTPAKCQEELEELLGEQKAYQLMYLAKELAEASCIPHSPRCAQCALVAVCRGARKSKAG
jgi:endonuclease III